MSIRRVYRTHRCRDCKRPIIFLRNGERSIPVDASSVGPYDREYVPNSRHKSHFDTCPNRQRKATPERPAKRRPLFGYDD